MFERKDFSVGTKVRIVECFHAGILHFFRNSETGVILDFDTNYSEQEVALVRLDQPVRNIDEVWFTLENLIPLHETMEEFRQEKLF